MRKILMTYVLGGLVFGASQARADVTYDFAISGAHGSVVTANGITNNGTGFTGFPLSLTFTDAGVASGEVNGSLSSVLFSVPAQIGLAGFVSLSTFMDGATPAALADSLSLDFHFNGAGAVTSDTLNFSGTDLTLALVNGAASVGSDGLLNCTAEVTSGACTATGSFVRRAAAVPEPETMLLLAGALTALAALRRQDNS